MKKVFLSIVFIIAVASFAIAQSGSGYGVKAGLSYNTNGDFVASAENIKENPKGAVGYHIGAFGKVALGNILYVKPELVYTKTKSEYNGADFDLQRIDAPVLLGYQILGPASVFIGPAFQYIVDSKLEDTKIESIKSDFTVGLNLGVAVNLNNIGLDVRYERGFTKNEATIFANNTSVEVGRLTTRPEQITVSVSFKI